MPRVADMFPQAVAQVREEANNLAEAMPLAGVTPEEMTDLVNSMIGKGFLPEPVSFPIVTGMDTIAVVGMGVLIGLRAAELLELQKLESIGSLDDPA